MLRLVGFADKSKEGVTTCTVRLAVCVIVVLVPDDDVVVAVPEIVIG